MKNYILKIFIFIVIAGLVFFLFDFLTKEKPVDITNIVVKEEVVEEEKFTSEVQYKNDIYGFSVYLPKTWKDYSVIEDEWEGYSLEVQSPQGQVITETGPLVSVRHPDWEYKSPRQDVPVMVFTLNQWSNLSREKFRIGAAPIKPTELGRNAKYVFALPARYNYSFLTGYEEVQELLAKKPFTFFSAQ